MGESGPDMVEKPGQWGVVGLAWTIVGVPLVWGVWNTLVKASALFK